VDEERTLLLLDDQSEESGYGVRHSPEKKVNTGDLYPQKQGDEV
jgi:hypothetical protein